VTEAVGNPKRKPSNAQREAGAGGWKKRMVADGLVVADGSAHMAFGSNSNPAGRWLPD
jgi:hypothetical protein